MAIGGEELLSDVAAAEFRDQSLGLSKWFDLLGWNPLDKSSDGSSWYSTLHEYAQSYDEHADAETSEPPPGGDQVSAMISTAVFPPFRKSLESGDFDPYPGRDVKRVIDAAKQVEAPIDSDHRKLLMILKSAHGVFENAAIAAESLLSPFLRFNRPQFDPEGIAARIQLLTRASKLVRVMLCWRKYTGDRLSAAALCVPLTRTTHS
ncbi:hypothetical protein EDD16DRAFT_1701228 [Pisolithus croceorrhizus]|nr:hypothetical protein EDD16DRAFT_1701228 [Pisolithus croceorrhizus]KAI6129950.1 hypothetical protein EV401DRAFT_2066464 [Pisolithus croceorrhizus]KAI6166566.1 hypothetical protein EDD17DRAFT_1752729 [Pisolithus thermaeus]